MKQTNAFSKIFAGFFSRQVISRLN